MTRIDWGVPITAIYEHGIDRGVFYPRVGAGVPWVGLVAVDEPVSGGAHTPYYFDGIKYYDFIASEDFQAAVEAFAAPAAFAACDGTQQLSPGLYATQQRRERFSFSYRTLVADAGNDMGAYKLHLVWNCTALPSPRSYSTLSNVPGAPTRSWTFSTVPPASSTFKPTAHLVIDSREVHSARLAAIEDILYGTASTTPRMPTQAEILAIFADPGPIRRTNYILDPRVTSVANWVVPVNVTKTDVGSGSGDGIQIDRTALGSGLILTFSNVAAQQPVAGAGEKWAGMMQIAVPSGFPVLNYTLRVNAVTAGTVIAQKSGAIGEDEELTVKTDFLALSGVGTTAIRLGLFLQDAPSGARVIITRAMLEKDVDVCGTFFHGSSTDTETVTYEWAGAIDGSLSYAKSWDLL